MGSLLRIIFIWALAIQIANAKQVISFQEWIDAMKASGESMYYVEEVRVVLDPKKDAEYFKTDRPHFDIYCPVFMQDVEFSLGENFIMSPSLLRINFYQPVEIRISGIKTGAAEMGQTVIQECKFFEKLSIPVSEDGSLVFIRSRAFKDVNLAFLGVSSNLSLRDSYCEDLLVRGELGFAEIRSSFVKQLNLMGDVVRLDFDKSVFDALIFQTGVQIKDYFKITGCKVKGFVSFGNFSFPRENFFFDYGQISGLLAWQHMPDEKYYLYTSDSIFRYHEKYKAMLSVFAKLQTLYKYMGDSESDDLCYVDKKTLETLRKRHEYFEKPNINTWFEWRVNEFLAFFCSYGTDPVRSLIYSLYVVLLFALFYIFFPSERDNLSISRLRAKLEKIGSYLSSDLSLDDVQFEDRRHQIKKAELLNQSLRKYKENMPDFISFFVKILYSVNTAYYFMLKKFYRITDFAPGKWTTLSASRRAFAITTLALYFGWYFSLGLLMRLLNATALSMNAFITLGYGEIHAKGVSRYMAVLEGVIGWFLLSIFSVSLISQILE